MDNKSAEEKKYTADQLKMHYEGKRIKSFMLHPMNQHGWKTGAPNEMAEFYPWNQALIYEESGKMRYRLELYAGEECDELISETFYPMGQYILAVEYYGK